jgi:hypothetical protein
MLALLLLCGCGFSGEAAARGARGAVEPRGTLHTNAHRARAPRRAAATAAAIADAFYAHIVYADVCNVHVCNGVDSERII